MLYPAYDQINGECFWSTTIIYICSPFHNVILQNLDYGDVTLLL